MRDTLIFLALLAALVAAMVGDLFALTGRRHVLMATISLAAGVIVLVYYLTDAILGPWLGNAWQTWTFQYQVVGLILVPLAYLTALALAAIIGITTLTPRKGR